MYAIITDGERQYKVEPGQELDLDYRDLPPGQTFTFERVLAYSNGSDVRIGQPNVAGVTVTAEIVGPTQGPKLVVQKKRRRKNYKRRTGHRQIHTRVKISAING